MLIGMRVTGALTCLLLASACASGSGDGRRATGGAGAAVATHHDTTLPAGAGLHARYVGYSIRDLRLPDEAGTPGRYAFRIGTWRHRPQTRFQVDQTKRMHVYLVRDDLAVFRHLHPTMAADGTWHGLVTVPEPGTYRLVAEFVATDSGGNGDHLVLADSDVVGRRVAPVPFGPVTGRGSADGLTVTVREPATTGSDGEMRLGFSAHGRPAALGTFLGAYGHVTAIARHSGAVVHIHPLGSPATSGRESVLRFHTVFRRADDYRLFVQVRVSGIVRTIPVDVHIGDGPTEP